MIFNQSFLHLFAQFCFQFSLFLDFLRSFYRNYPYLQVFSMSMNYLFFSDYSSFIPKNPHNNPKTQIFSENEHKNTRKRPCNYLSCLLLAKENKLQTPITTSKQRS